MDSKKILLGILLLLSTVIYAQSDKSVSKESEISVSSLKFDTDNIDELRNFDWNMIKEMFEENDTDEEITLEFVYKNKPETDISKASVNNFTMKFTGKTSELDELMDRMKKSFKILGKINEQNNKN